jgi:hypothetical protein
LQETKKLKYHSIRGVIPPLLLGGLLLALHIHYYYPFFSDDSLISLRYAQRLLDGQGLTWTDGHPVEGYSNLLWILGSALLGLLGVDLIMAVRLLGALGAAAVFAALWYRRARSAEPPAAALAAFSVGAAVWALSAPAAIWALAGLEAPMFAALLAWGLVTLIDAESKKASSPKGLALPGLLFGLMCLTRPDGPVICGLAALWIALTGRSRFEGIVRAAAFLAVPVLLVLGQLVFRLSYYGEWLPNVAHVKISPSVSHFYGGVLYVGRGLWALMPASGIAVVGLVFLVAKDRARRGPALLLLVLMAGWLGYIAFIGGDIFRGWRHLVPFVVMMVVAIVLFAEWLVQRKPVQKKIWVPAVILAAGWFTAGQLYDGNNRYARGDLWVWNCEVVGRALKGGFSGTNPLLAVTAAGGIPYWSELPCIDMLGLNDYAIARTELPETGQQWIGHGRANADYLLERRPDLIHFGTAGGDTPRYMYKDLLEDRDDFWDNYMLCNIAGLTPFGFPTRIYVRKNSPKIGIVSTSDSVYVPPYFLNATGTAVAILEESTNRFVIDLKDGESIGIYSLEIAAGLWEVVMPGSGTGVQVMRLDTEEITKPEFVEGVPMLRLEASGNYHVMIRVLGVHTVPVYGLALRAR